MRPVLLELGPLKVYGYGALVVLGGALAFRWLWRRRRGAGLRTEDEYWTFVTVTLLSAVAGARLLFWAEYGGGGYSFFGGFFGVWAAVAWFSRSRGAAFWPLIDHVSWMMPFWHVFGRLGCLLAGCCHGRPTDVPWAVVFTDPASMVRRRWLGVPLHPTQLYEAAAEALIALALLPGLRSKPGTVTAGYFMMYGAARAAVEVWRGDTVPGWAGLTAGQWLGAALFAAGGMVLWYTRCCRRS